MEDDLKRIIWIDKNVNNGENQFFLEILQNGINNSKFYLVESVEEAFKLIKTKKEIVIEGYKEKEVKIFQFRLFYVIVSGSLSNEFFNEYIKATKELTIISSNIIFCSDEDKHKRNAYYLDDFLNPGRVYNHNTISQLMEYINLDESPFLKEPIAIENFQEYRPLIESNGNIFFKANNITDIAYPMFFGQLINSTLINDYDLEAFRTFMLNYYPELKYLIFPSKEKKISIPYYLLAKFFLHMYSHNSKFFNNINSDLTNNKFNLYRVYIFLLYDALKKKSIQSYYSKKLYKGTFLNKNELDIINNLIIHKNFNNNNNMNMNININACLYTTKKFLSFNKNIDIAKSCLHEGNNDVVPVLFELEGLTLTEEEINKTDFFFSNLDLYNITEYNTDEVLFLPYSTFEIVLVKNETINIFGDMIKIKKIILRYIYKYRSPLYQHIGKILKKELFENFINQIINSKFYKVISNVIGFDEELLKIFVKKKFFLDNKIFNYNLNLLNKKKINLSTGQIAFNSRFPSLPKSMQKILFENQEAILLRLQNGLDIILRIRNNKILYKSLVNVNEYVPPVEYVGEPITLKCVNNANVINKMVGCLKNNNNGPINNYMKEIKKEDAKLLIEKNNYYEFYTCGLIIGDMIANYNDIKNEPLMVQISSLGKTAIACLIPFLPQILGTFCPKAIVSKIPVITTAISGVELILSLKDVISNNNLTTSETCRLIFRTISIKIGQIALSSAISAIGFKILVALNISPGIVVGLAAVGIGVGAGFAISKIKKIFDEKEKDNSGNLCLFSNSTYYQYIPKKYREYCIPTLCWNGVSKNAKSFAIELIEDGYRKWLIINIKHWIRKIHNDNYLDVGDNIVKYQGISKHPYKVTFILYELKKEVCTPEEWGVGEHIKDNYSEELSKNFNQVTVLEVF